MSRKEKVNPERLMWAIIIGVVLVGICLMVGRFMQRFAS